MSSVIYLKIPDYQTTDYNPYAYYNDSPKSLQFVAEPIDTAIKSNFAGKSLLFRFVQSGKKSLPRDKYIEQILASGNDKTGDYENTELKTVEGIDLYAGVYDFTAGVEGVLTSLHKFKPKCDEKPQYIYDILMIFNSDAYQQTDYLHPRHKVIAKDGYKLKPSIDPRKALLGIVVIN